MRRLASTVLLGAILLQAGAAPAPPSRAVTAEVVVAPTGNLQQVARSLCSAEVLSAIVRSQKGRELACLKREKNPADWLGARLKVVVDEKRRAVTIPLVGCHKRDALPLLWAVVEGYKGRALGSDREMAALMQMQQARLVRLGGRVAPGQQQMEVLISGLEADMKNFVIQPPHLVPDGR